VDIVLIDSQTIAAGLGYLVETAVEASHQGKRASDIEYMIRSLISHTYGVFCTPSLSYLHYNGFVDLGQATVTEMLSLFPIFAVEEGKLTPMEKLRNHRQTVTYFQEFLDEFDHLQFIGLVQSAPPNQQDANILREHAHENYPKTPFTTHTINLATATMFGPRTIGLFAVENPY
jgi:DegV family protein with EDD domain